MKLFRLKFPLVGSLLVGVAWPSQRALRRRSIRARRPTGRESGQLSSTYNFVAEPGTNRGGYSTPITGYFKNAISRELNARGYKLVEE